MSIEPVTIVGPGVYRSGQPTPEQFSAYRHKYKLKTVISLVGGTEAIAKECALVSELGMMYYSIPMPGWLPPSKDDVDKALTILSAVSFQPVLLHCTHGQDRSGLVVACYRIDIGWDVDAALIEAKEPCSSGRSLCWSGRR